MHRSDRDLDELQRLLGECLVRIDEQALQLRQGEDVDVDAVADGLDHTAAQLQGLVARILDAAAPDRPEHADLDATVERCVRSALQEFGTPLVLRCRLAGRLPPVACTPGQLACTVQRALVLAASHAGHGGELAITTRSDRHGVVFEVSCARGDEDRHLAERALTLRAFVASFHGHCAVDVDPAGVLWLAVEVPAALPARGR